MAAILAVDNEDIVVDVIRASLEAKGHTLTTACSVAEALQRAGRMKRIDVLIINHMIIPGEAARLPSILCNRTLI